MHYEALDVRIDLAEDDQADEETGHGKAVAAKPVEIFLGGGFGHEEHDSCAAVERRNGKKIESTEEEVHQKHGNESGEEEVVVSIGLKVEEVQSAAGTKGEGSKEHEREICGGTGQSHPGRALGVAAFPERVERCAGPTNHASRKKETEKRDDDHAKRFATDVRDWIESDLAAEGGCRVATAIGDESMSGFMTSCRKKKDRVRDEGDHEVLWVELIHRRVRLEI